MLCMKIGEDTLAKMLKCNQNVTEGVLYFIH